LPVGLRLPNHLTWLCRRPLFVLLDSPVFPWWCASCECGSYPSRLGLDSVALSCASALGPKGFVRSPGFCTQSFGVIPVHPSSSHSVTRCFRCRPGYWTLSGHPSSLLSIASKESLSTLYTLPSTATFPPYSPLVRSWSLLWIAPVTQNRMCQGCGNNLGSITLLASPDNPY